MLFLKTISTQVQAVWQAITHSDIATGGSGNGSKVLYDDMSWRTPNGTNAIIGTTEVIFELEDNTAFTTVNNTDLTNSNYKGFSYIPIEVDNTSLDDFSLNGVNFTLENIVNNTSFTIRATASNGATGNYAIKYIILRS